MKGRLLSTDKEFKLEFAAKHINKLLFTNVGTDCQLQFIRVLLMYNYINVKVTVKKHTFLRETLFQMFIIMGEWILVHGQCLSDKFVGRGNFGSAVHYECLSAFQWLRKIYVRIISRIILVKNSRRANIYWIPVSMHTFSQCFCFFDDLRPSAVAMNFWRKVKANDLINLDVYIALTSIIWTWKWRVQILNLSTIWSFRVCGCCGLNNKTWLPMSKFTCYKVRFYLFIYIMINFAWSILFKILYVKQLM